VQQTPAWLLAATPPLPPTLPAQIPGGWAAQRWGGRATLIVSFLAWSTACLVTPGSASRVGLIVAARVAVGLAQGGVIPSIHTVLSQVKQTGGGGGGRRVTASVGLIVAAGLA
jgi:MFS family permease